MQIALAPGKQERADEKLCPSPSAQVLLLSTFCSTPSAQLLLLNCLRLTTSLSMDDVSEFSSTVSAHFGSQTFIMVAIELITLSSSQRLRSSLRTIVSSPSVRAKQSLRHVILIRISQNTTSTGQSIAISRRVCLASYATNTMDLADMLIIWCCPGPAILHLKIPNHI